MTQKVADQHALLTRWREIADELASVLQYLTYAPLRDAYTNPEAEAALRRYEAARDE